MHCWLRRVYTGAIQEPIPGEPSAILPLLDPKIPNTPLADLLFQPSYEPSEHRGVS